MSDPQAVVLYPFRRRDPLSGKRYRARWKASPEEIERNRCIVEGPAESYAALGATSNFQGERLSILRDNRPQIHPQRESLPAIEQLERFLACVFLRRYVTHCVRRKRYAQVQGAAALF